LAIRTANENNSTVILANDPDADRLAVAEKQSNGEWKIFNGNEIGALLGWWLWNNFSARNPPEAVKNAYMLYSTVSSHILKAIAEKEGFNCEDTLTGFKWMGNRANQLLQDGKQVVFSFEEAIGFMCGTNVLDKDGVSAESVVAEMAIYLNEVEQRRLSEQLDWIYDKYSTYFLFLYLAKNLIFMILVLSYGYHVSNNSYYLCYEQENINKMFFKLRHTKNLNSQEEDYSVI
jgi:phosphoglucomutase/phosphopentomutase